MSRKSTLSINFSREEKEYFEKAAELWRFKSLGDFGLAAASEKAEAIVQKHNAWLASENDQKIFFTALLNPPAANARLKHVMKRCNEFNSKKY